MTQSGAPALNPLPVVRALLETPTTTAPPVPPPSDLSSVALESDLLNRTLQLGNKAIGRAQDAGAAAAAQAERVARLAQSIQAAALPGDPRDPWVRLGQIAFWGLMIGLALMIVHGLILLLLWKKGKKARGALVFGRLELMVSNDLFFFILYRMYGGMTFNHLVHNTIIAFHEVASCFTFLVM
jgi:hypothetical protein